MRRNDNTSCESFVKTLKREEVYANEYRDLNHLRENIAAFIDTYYNCVRLHSALAYRPPEEFEQAAGLSRQSGKVSKIVERESLLVCFEMVGPRGPLGALYDPA
jgi:putative transposase